MNSLLEEVIAKHGGFERWERYNRVSADVSIKGATWVRRGWADALADVTVEATTRQPWASYRRFSRPDWTSTWEPQEVSVIDSNDQVIIRRPQPLSSFDGHDFATKWDEGHLAYFSGYAMWNYLVSPFIFSWPGFEVEQLSDFFEDGERRRRLRVVFPDAIPTHNKEQIFYVDDAGFLRRLDYSANVTGKIPTAHYLSEYKVFDGIAFPTKRRAYKRNPDDSSESGFLAVAIDTFAVRLS